MSLRINYIKSKYVLVIWSPNSKLVDHFNRDPTISMTKMKMLDIPEVEVIYVNFCNINIRTRKDIFPSSKSIYYRAVDSECAQLFLNFLFVFKILIYIYLGFIFSHFEREILFDWITFEKLPEVRKLKIKNVETAKQMFAFTKPSIILEPKEIAKYCCFTHILPRTAPSG